MNLVRRTFLRKGVLSLIITAAVIAVLFFVAPHAQALTITVANLNGGTVGSPITFEVTVTVQDVDQLPIDHVNLKIHEQGNPSSPQSIEYLNLPLPDGPSLPVQRSYTQDGSTLDVTATGGAYWGASNQSRYGYGYVDGSGYITQTYTPGYGYGYVDGDDFIGETTLTYALTWTSPSGWPAGDYEVRVLVYGDATRSITHEQTYTFTLTADGGGGGGGGGGPPAGVTFVYENIYPDGRIIDDMTAESTDKRVKLEILQSNHEGEIVSAIGKAKKELAALLINPAAYTHTSVAIRDAILACSLPTVEVHLSNIYAREEFRQKSLISPVVCGGIYGFGLDSYMLGLNAAILLAKKSTREIE